MFVLLISNVGLAAFVCEPKVPVILDSGNPSSIWNAFTNVIKVVEYDTPSISMGVYPALPEYVLFSHVCASITFWFSAPTSESSTTAALVVIGKLKNTLEYTSKY